MDSDARGALSTGVHVIHLLTESGRKPPLGALDYDLQVDKENRVITVSKSINFEFDQPAYNPPEQTPELYSSPNGGPP